MESERNPPTQKMEKKLLNIVSLDKLRSIVSSCPSLPLQMGKLWYISKSKLYAYAETGKLIVSTKARFLVLMSAPSLMKVFLGHEIYPFVHPLSTLHPKNMASSGRM